MKNREKCGWILPKHGSKGWNCIFGCRKKAFRIRRRLVVDGQGNNRDPAEKEPHFTLAAE